LSTHKDEREAQQHLEHSFIQSNCTPPYHHII
jgi:hypothetical protein